jgi:hypothetical protein
VCIARFYSLLRYGLNLLGIGGKSRIAEILRRLGTVVLHLVAMRTSFPSLGLGKGFGPCQLGLNLCVYQIKVGIQVRRVRTQLATREQLVSVYNHHAFGYEAGSSAYNTE